MTQVSGGDLVYALNNNPEFLMLSKPVIDFNNEFMLKVPEVLKKNLDEPVTVLSIVNTKIAFLRYCVENDYVAKMVAVMPEGSLGCADADQVVEMMQKALVKAIDLFSQIASDVPAYLRLYGTTEEQVIKDFKVRPELMALYRDGILTIGDLLNLQPMVIIQNS